MFWICRAPVGRFILRFLVVIFLAIIVLLCVRSYLSLYHHKLDISWPLRRTQDESVHNSNNINRDNGFVPHQTHTILGNHAALKGSIDVRKQSTRRGSVDIVIVDEHHEGKPLVLEKFLNTSIYSKLLNQLIFLSTTNIMFHSRTTQLYIFVLNYTICRCMFCYLQFSSTGFHLVTTS